MSVLLSSIGTSASFHDTDVDYISDIKSIAGGGYVALRYSYSQDIGYEYSLQDVGEDGKLGGITIVPLSGGFVSDMNVEANGSYTFAVSDRTEAGVQSVSLASMTRDGELRTFYTTKIQSLKPKDFDPDFGVAFNDKGIIALARLGGSGTKLARAVDIFDAQHRKAASVVVDKDMTGDQHQSTSVLALSNGNFLVTWVESNSKGASVKAQIVTSAGKLSGSNFTIARVDDLATPDDVYLSYKTLALSNGGFTVGYQGREDYYDPADPTGVETIRTPITLTNWLPGPNGKFVKGADLMQDTSLIESRVANLVTLSDGRILELVSEERSGSDEITLKTLHGYLYDQSGGVAKDHFVFYTQAENGYFFEEDYRIEAGESGTFILVKSDYDITTRLDFNDSLQIYGLGTAAYTTVNGATAGNDTLRGNATRSDLIDGSDGNDTLLGLGSSDKLLGGKGNDRLDGGAGIDRMEGGQGNDTYVVDTLGDHVVEASKAGSDTVLASISYTLADNVENLTLTGVAALRGFGNGLANTMTGNAGKNVLYGLGGADVLDGGRGADTLYGGSGADRFVFKATFESGASATTRDTIADFSQSAHDKIDLTQIDANTKMSGVQDFSFIGASNFTGKAGELNYVYTDIGTLLSGDVTGDGKADFSVLLQGKIALSQSDFI